MAQLSHTKVLLIYVLLFLFCVSVSFSAWLEPQFESTQLSSSRKMLDTEKEEQDKPLKKKTTTPTQSTKNHTKLIKPTSSSSKNQTKSIKSDNIISSKKQTKTIKPNLSSSKNQTKTIKPNLSSSKNQTKTIKPNLISTKNQTKTSKSPNNISTKSNNISSKNQTKPLKLTSNSPSKNKPIDTSLNLKKLNNSTAPKVKKLNVTSKPNPVIPSKKSLDLVKSSNKTTKSTATTKDNNKTKQTKTSKQDTKKKPTKQTPPSWIMEDEDEDEDDLVSHFTDLPNKFHRTLIPDLERISTTSKAYITKANNEITKNFKPYVGKKYAPTVATVISIAFILIPLLLVSLLCTKIKAYFSLQKILIFIQIYLSLYFTILCFTTFFTGLEPLKFLYSTSRSTYLCLQVLQTLAYLFYLLMLLMYLVLVFSTDCGLGSKFLGLAQVLVGFSVGLHYYVTVFHRVVLQQPPKTNWKIHGIYATCFLVVGFLARADRRKKTYVEDGGGEGKKN